MSASSAGMALRESPLVDRLSPSRLTRGSRCPDGIPVNSFALAPFLDVRVKRGHGVARIPARGQAVPLALDARVQMPGRDPRQFIRIGAVPGCPRQARA